MNLEALVYIIMTTFMIQIRTYHYTCTSYEHHLIVDEFLNSYLKNYDKFIEVSIGKFGKLNLGDFNLKIKNITSQNINSFIDDFLEFLEILTKKYSNNNNLLSIRDEIENDTLIMRYKLSISK
jgi:hypothetical protein